MSQGCFLHLKEVAGTCFHLIPRWQLCAMPLKPPACVWHGSSKELSDASTESSHKPCQFPQLQSLWLQLCLRCSASLLQNCLWRLVVGEQFIMVSHTYTFLIIWLDSCFDLALGLSVVERHWRLLKHMRVHQAFRSLAG